MPSTFDKPPPAAPFQLAAKVANNSDLDIFTRPNAYDAEEREIFPDMKRIRRETSAASPNLLERRRRDLHLQIDTEETIRVRKNPVGYPPPQGRTHKMAPFLPTTPTRQHISPYAHTGRGSGHRRFNGTVDPRLQVGSVSYQQPSIQFAKSSRDGFNGVSSMQRNWHNQYRVRNGSGLSQQERELREHSMRIASLQEKRLEPRGSTYDLGTNSVQSVPCSSRSRNSS